MSVAQMRIIDRLRAGEELLRFSYTRRWSFRNSNEPVHHAAAASLERSGCIVSGPRIGGAATGHYQYRLAPHMEIPTMQFSQRLDSADGSRYALGQYVNHGVEVWELRCREGREVVTVAHDMDRDHATEWVSPAGEEALRRWVRCGIGPYRHRRSPA